MLVPNPPSTEEVRQKLYRAVGDRLAGYELEQIHGQRKLFNPELKRLFTPAEGSEVFIGRLPRDLFEDELVPPFLEIGPIYEMRVMMNFSGTNRGFAFVMYKNPETAMRAVKSLNNCEIRRGHQIGVLTSVNNRRIYIGPLQESPNMKQILFYLLSQLTEGVQCVSIFPNKRNPQAQGKFAVVAYNTHREAAMARRQLLPIKNSFFGPNIMIDWADPRLKGKRLTSF